MNIGCVVMAAGAASRFGGDKLAAELGGTSLLRRALDAVAAEKFSAVAVVSGRAEALAQAAERGFLPVCNSRPDLGVSRTIRLGLEALGAVDGALFLVADQPLLRRESVAALADFFRTAPEQIAALSCSGQRGNPVIFPRKYFLELLSLTGDRGGGVVIRRHPDALRLLEVPAEELMDVDTVEELRRLRELDK